MQVILKHEIIIIINSIFLNKKTMVKHNILFYYNYNNINIDTCITLY